MFDPDIPKLWDILKQLRAGVESGAFTPDAACEILGKHADSLIERRKKEKPNWREEVSDAWNAGEEKYRREVLGQ